MKILTLFLSFFLSTNLALAEVSQRDLTPVLQVPIDTPNGELLGTAMAKSQFTVTGQILGMTTYNDGWKSSIAPVDLAIGWGPLKQRKALDELRFKQGDRFYYWQIPEDQLQTWNAPMIVLHSTNIHIVPATPQLARDLLTLRPGDQVTLTGHLVDVLDPKGLLWETSMTRVDTGPGACEILLLSSITYHPHNNQSDSEKSINPESP